jgi:hypothetical protein
MKRERLQICLSLEQRHRLQSEADARETSVSSLVREAIDAHFGTVSAEQRRAAIQRMRQRNAEEMQPDQLKALIDGRFDGPGPTRK